MPNPATAFSTGSTIALLSWLALAASLFLAPATRSGIWSGTTIVVPALLAIAYAVLLAQGMKAGTGGGFGTIEAVRRLFSNDAALAAGWLHYLAFDLFVGTWIAREGLDARIPALLLLPCLLATFMVGPVGLLLFLVLRFAFAHRLGVSA